MMVNKNIKHVITIKGVRCRLNTGKQLWEVLDKSGNIIAHHDCIETCLKEIEEGKYGSYS